MYGEQFDSERYLKRFFDQEYLLPSPDNARFTAFLFERYALNDFDAFYTVIEDNIYDPTPSDQALFTTLCDSFKLGLRDQEQVAGTLQTVLLNWPTGERIHLAYLLFLIIAKHISIPLFQQLADKQLVDSSKFSGALSTKLRENATFKTRDNTGGETERNVLDMLWTYQSLRNRACRDLWEQNSGNTIKFPGKILTAVCEDCPRTVLRGENPIPPISDYARRVSQAGQLSNVMQKT